MKIGICISMYAEEDIVLKSIQNIRRIFESDAYISIIQSGNRNTTPRIVDEIKALSGIFEILPNVADWIDNPWKVPSHSLVRNYNRAFVNLYEMLDYYKVEVDLIVGMTGDTLVTDATNFNRIYQTMQAEKMTAYVSQAIGCDFHAPTSDPQQGKEGGRMQHEDIHDFMPQLFFIDGKIARKTEAFTKIKLVNEFTTEHCLGDELARVTSGVPFKLVVKRYCKGSNRYRDGIIYQAKGKI